MNQELCVFFQGTCGVFLREELPVFIKLVSQVEHDGARLENSHLRFTWHTWRSKDMF